MLITVVIATYNRRALLAQCLASLFSQTRSPQDFEIAVVIDGGTDDTRDYLEGLQFPCASQIIEQENRGQAAARNAGIRAAHSPYILILDDDFICDSALIEQHLDAHDGSGNVVLGPISHNDADLSVPTLAIDREIRPFYERLESGTFQIPWFPPNSSAPRELLLSFGGYDEAFSSAREDTDLGIRLASAGVKFRYAPSAVVRQHYDKTADQLVSDAATFGKHDVMLARKSPAYAAQSNLSRLNSGPLWKRASRRLVAALPFSLEPFLYPSYGVSSLLSKIPLMREAAIRLLNLRRYIVWVRAASGEAGGWHSLVSLNYPTGTHQPSRTIDMPDIDAREKTRLMRDGIIHALGLVLSSIAGLILVPLMVHGLGVEGYGLWAAAMAAIGIFGAFDLGLRLLIVRDIAGDPHSREAPAVRIMLWIHFFVGLLAAGAVAFGGSISSRHLRLSASAQTLAPLVFGIAGAICFFDQLFAWILSVLAGLRRFDLLNLFSIGTSLLRLALFAGALVLGRGLIAILALQLSISALSVLIGLAYIAITSPELRPRLEPIHWEILREPLGFGVLSQAATSISSLQMPISTLLISVINGAAAVTPFTIGQKFPGLVSGLTWRTSEVFFPVASRQRHGSAVDSQAFLGAITRWLMLIIAPCAFGVFLIAPLLLRTWMGEVNPVALTVLRIAALSVVVETVIPGAVQLFFGASETGPVMAVNLATVIADIALALLLLPRMGATGAAWATLGSTALAAMLFLRLAARRRNLSTAAVLTQAIRRLTPALAAVLLPAYFLVRIAASRSWPAIIGIVALSAALYLVILWIYAASPDEKALLVTLFPARDTRPRSTGATGQN